MGFQSGINQVLGATAAASMAIKSEVDKEKKSMEEANEMKTSKQIALKKEDADLNIKEAKNALDIAKAKYELDEAQEAYDKVAPDDKGRYRDKGKFISKKEGEKRSAPARHNLEIMKKALEIRNKEQEALSLQRAQWKLNIGGTK